MLDKARLLEAIANRRHVCKVVISDQFEPSEAAKALWEWRLDALEEITTMIESGAYDAPASGVSDDSRSDSAGCVSDVRRISGLGG